MNEYYNLSESYKIIERATNALSSKRGNTARSARDDKNQGVYERREYGEHRADNSSGVTGDKKSYNLTTATIIGSR